MSLRRAIFPVLAAAIAAAATAQTGAPSLRYCEVAMDFSVNGRPVAAPSAIVEFGQQADVTIGDEMHGWRFSIVADEPKIVHRASVIPIEIDLYELANGESVLRASPHFAVAPGQRADLETIFADDSRKARIGLVANLRSEAEIEPLRNGQDSEKLN